MKKLSLLAVLSLLVSCQAAPAGTGSEAVTAPLSGTVTVAGQERSYRLFVPPGLDRSQAVPLVIALHAHGQPPEHLYLISGWNELATREKLLVVYPSGTGAPLSWQIRGGADPQAEQPDEGFIQALIDTLGSQYKLDPRRVYATGLSNGGGMAHLLACRLSARIAAISVVGGAFLFPDAACQPSRPVPLLMIHGNADQVVPYQGGASDSFTGTFPKIPDFAAAWAKRNQCQGSESLPAKGKLSGISYTNCAAQADVQLYTLDGFGHGWTSGTDIDAAQTSWDFFKAHPLPESAN